MNEGTNAQLVICDTSYPVDHYKINKGEDYFQSTLELNLQTPIENIALKELYTGVLKVNGDAIWYLPWMWFQETGQQTKASLSGAIFCPFGLSEEDEERYESINLLIACEVYQAMTPDVWRNMLEIFADWLKNRSIPQYQDFLDLAKEI